MSDPMNDEQRALLMTKNAGSTLQAVCHAFAYGAGWWHDLSTGEDMTTRKSEKPKRNVGELLCLVHSEISEAMEGHRKGKMDEHIPGRLSMEVELADCVIRIADLCGGLGLDLGGAIADKLAYNAARADHRPENRRADGGKKF